MNRSTTAGKPHPVCVGFVAVMLLAMSAIYPASMLACGFCIAPRGGLTAIHPKSLDVAIAVRRDIDRGLLKQNRVTSAGRAKHHVRDIHTGRILAERFFVREGFELLLIEDGSHYRIEGAQTLRHRKRVVPPSIRWITSRTVLQSLLMNELDFETAVKRGLVVVEKRPVGEAGHDGTTWSAR